MKILLKTAAIAAAMLTIAAFAAAPAAADSWYKSSGLSIKVGSGHHGHYGHRYRHHGRHHAKHWRGPRRVVVISRPRPVYVVRPPVTVYQSYQSPPTVVYVPAPGAIASPPPPQVASSYCREYTETVVIGGQTHSAYGTACQQPDGSWQKID
ncbi:MAG: hypothetical protein GEU92_09055 [Alphaproteobacteria bacterium]|nr:hypothetical protein [Alphaproteobacteria bacterium]